MTTTTASLSPLKMYINVPSNQELDNQHSLGLRYITERIGDGRKYIVTPEMLINDQANHSNAMLFENNKHAEAYFRANFM
jgi:hypothetical protein